jgi:hypothetical protein
MFLTGFAVAADVLDLRVLEDPDVIVRCLLRLAVEPEAGRDTGFRWDFDSPGLFVTG